MFSFVLGFIVLMACLYIVVRRQTRDKLPRFVDCFACGKQHLGRGSYQNNNHHKAYCIASRGWQIPESEKFDCEHCGLNGIYCHPRIMEHHDWGNCERGEL